VLILRAQLSLPNLAIGRDPFLWNEPDTFEPERWMAYNADAMPLPVKRADEIVHPIFWAGKRLCLGKDMARFEVIVFMNKMLAKFQMVLVPGQSEEMVGGPVMFAKHGIRCAIQRRSGM
jgi:cytochrome P450